jgi:hypothetical protein
MLTDFLTWMVNEAWRPSIDPPVLQSYEHAFQDHLRALIRRTHDPKLRATFEEMLSCPLRDRRGRCRGFAEYIYGALLKNGIDKRYDMEAAIAYVIEKMLMDTSDTGDKRTNLFTGFEERPDYVEGNPLQARFMKYLQFAVNNIKKGKIPRLADNASHPPGTVSIGQGRTKQGDSASGISPDSIPGRQNRDADLDEMIGDITTWLRRREMSSRLPLVKIFQAIMSGMNTEQQRARFGDRVTREARPIVVQVIRQYAEKTENYSLLAMLRRYEGFQSNKSMPAKRTPPKATTPKREPGRDSDFASVVSVIERLGRPAGSADLMKYRRRWLEYPPRTQEAGYKNRLEEVLALAVKEGVLKAMKTAKGATIYDLGPNAERYRQVVANTT